MELSIAIVVAIILIVVLFEYRIRRPDQIVLGESDGDISRRRMPIYPRHFSLALPTHVHSSVLEIEAEATGKLAVFVKLSASVAADQDHLPALVRAGGWQEDAVSQAAGEFELLLQSKVRAFTENHEIEELTTEKLFRYLDEQIGDRVEELGLEVISVTVQAIEPVDEEIATAMRQRESARIKEQTEVTEQEARITAAQSRIKADEEIARSEHKLSMEKLDLQEQKEDRESALETKRVKEDIERRKMQFELDAKEVELFRENPELLMLTPQIARLAEASQNLKNAKTVVSLSSKDFDEETPLMQTLRNLMQNLGQSVGKDKTSDTAE
ncbi:MAG: hypothetical protein K9N46_14785 [Candidatus Marinimicrobia bacterium]|nr:hypothetical protein [Candidatus Neomarinimicrobiota bacterium]MCF7828506.1 hypothetical protein [Candidatus Neomarinimicrobiota bacterium]MCF7881996.1 hypothetical protein [Candidatus Neomarinimicrobiota bacterium]